MERRHCAVANGVLIGSISFSIIATKQVYYLACKAFAYELFQTNRHGITDGQVNGQMTWCTVAIFVKITMGNHAYLRVGEYSNLYSLVHTYLFKFELY